MPDQPRDEVVGRLVFAPAGALKFAASTKADNRHPTLSFPTPVLE